MAYRRRRSTACSAWLQLLVLVSALFHSDSLGASQLQARRRAVVLYDQEPVGYAPWCAQDQSVMTAITGPKRADTSFVGQLLVELAVARDMLEILCINLRQQFGGTPRFSFDQHLTPAMLAEYITTEMDVVIAVGGRAAAASSFARELQSLSPSCGTADAAVPCEFHLFDIEAAMPRAAAVSETMVVWRCESLSSCQRVSAAAAGVDGDVRGAARLGGCLRQLMLAAPSSHSRAEKASVSSDITVEPPSSGKQRPAYYLFVAKMFH